VVNGTTFWMDEFGKSAVEEISSFSQKQKEDKEFK